MPEIDTPPCNHDRLTFGSGGYYIFCADCSAKWCRHAANRPEYGVDRDGKLIGAEPDNADDPQGERINANAIAQERARAERLKKALDAALVDLSLAETTAGDQYNELRVRIQDLQRRLRAALKESEDGNAG